MLFKIIIKNINRKNYFIFSLSATLYATIIFILLTLLNINDILNLGDKSENAKIIFCFYYILLSLAGLIFMFYSLKFYSNTRLGTYALFVVLGSSKKRVLKFILIEFFTICQSSIILGIIFGYLIIQCMCLVFSFNGTKIQIPIPEIFQNILITASISFILFIVTCLIFWVKFFRKDLSKIMIDGIQKEYSYHVVCLMGVIGIGLMIASICSLENVTFTKLLICMVLFLLGFYLLLTYGLCFILRFYKKYLVTSYLKNIIVINNYFFRYKANTNMTCITFFLNFIIIFIVGGVIITTSVKEDYISMYPFETVIIDYKSKNQTIENDLPKDVIKIDAYRGYLAKSEEGIENILAIKQDDYNRIMCENVNLKDQEMILIFQEKKEGMNEQFLSTGNFMTNEGERELKVSDIYFKVVFGVDVVRNYCLAIIPQEINNVKSKSSIYLTSYKINLDRQSDSNIQIFNRSTTIAVIKNNNKILKISSYFLAIFTVVCNLGVLFIKQISDIEPQLKKFLILKYLGMSKVTREKTIMKDFKILISFPIVFSNIMVWFFIKAELIRVGQFNWIYIKSFIWFQIFLLAIQYIFYVLVRRYILQRVNKCGDDYNGYIKSR